MIHKYHGFFIGASCNLFTLLTILVSIFFFLPTTYYLLNNLKPQTSNLKPSTLPCLRVQNVVLSLEDWSCIRHS